jgi:hypothetical protein
MAGLVMVKQLFDYAPNIEGKKRPSSVEFEPNERPPRGLLGGSRVATVLGGRVLFAGANGEKLKAVSGMVQRTCSIGALLCDRFRGMRGYSALGDSWYEHY